MRRLLANWPTLRDMLDITIGVALWVTVATLFGDGKPSPAYLQTIVTVCCTLRILDVVREGRN